LKRTLLILAFLGLCRFLSAWDDFRGHKVHWKEWNHSGAVLRRACVSHLLEAKKLGRAIDRGFPSRPSVVALAQSMVAPLAIAKSFESVPRDMRHVRVPGLTDEQKLDLFWRMLGEQYRGNCGGCIAYTIHEMQYFLGSKNVRVVWNSLDAVPEPLHLPKTRDHVFYLVDIGEEKPLIVDFSWGQFFDFSSNKGIRNRIELAFVGTQRELEDHVLRYRDYLRNDWGRDEATIRRYVQALYEP
jgi:hypothetical protein